MQPELNDFVVCPLGHLRRGDHREHQQPLEVLQREFALSAAAAASVYQRVPLPPSKAAGEEAKSLLWPDLLLPDRTVSAVFGCCGTPFCPSHVSIGRPHASHANAQPPSHTCRSRHAHTQRRPFGASQLGQSQPAAGHMNEYTRRVRNGFKNEALDSECREKAWPHEDPAREDAGAREPGLDSQQAGAAAP